MKIQLLKLDQVLTRVKYVALYINRENNNATDSISNRSP